MPAALATFASRGLGLGLILALLLLPSAVLTIGLVARAQTGSRVVRACIGIMAWVGWYLVVVGAVVIAGTIGLWPEGFAVLLALLAAAGGLFGLLTPAHEQAARTGGLAIAAVTIGALTLLGCFVTAGWWGNPG